MKELVEIQTKLTAPKNQKNKFGGYNYRSCEDILMAVKPLLAATKTTLILSDEIELIGDRYYIKATTTLRNSSGEEATAVGYAREPQSKKGFDESQITGAASSYARKYALNGLFSIDDTKDADATNTHCKNENTNQQDNKKVTQIKKDSARDAAAALYKTGKIFMESADSKENIIDYWDKNVMAFKDLPEAGYKELERIFNARLAEFEAAE
jgi:hypothetical protein